MSIADRFKTQEGIARFTHSFDVKDWSGLEDRWRHTLWLLSKR